MTQKTGFAKKIRELCGTIEHPLRPKLDGLQRFLEVLGKIDSFDMLTLSVHRKHNPLSKRPND